jgi:hypothetical protein
MGKIRMTPIFGADRRTRRAENACSENQAEFKHNLSRRKLSAPHVALP